ncbi:MAG: hypothetical protein KAI17_15830, partial [Thiotrichaceae bacterium]|nr:hypothetical protein [Thiotrichaceae bacterium]
TAYTDFEEDDLFSTIFTSDTLFPNLTLMQIFMHNCSEWTVTDASNVGFHTVAALLNASASENGHMTYGYTVAQVIALYNGTDYTNAQLAYKFLNLEDESPLYPWITCPLKPGGDQISCSEVTIPPTP